MLALLLRRKELVMQEETFNNVEQTTSDDKQGLRYNDVPQILQMLLPVIRLRLKHYSIHPNDQDDLCQDVLIKLYRAFMHFDFESDIPIEHYVNRVIKNVKNDYLRQKLYGYERQSMLINEYMVSYNYSKSERPLDTHIIAVDIGIRLQKSMVNLTHLEQTVVVYLLNGYKPNEIATTLDMQVKVIYNAIQRCKMKLKRIFKMEAI
ncbi:sigma-70 family RNA polymerase sigma factor [Staphylococcus caeli]|uniref:sigma-70 family RNA polymerase sigma factor n=1 Tax=Staphylococcus caeli TaxID=2201815 RepID=UPI003F559F8B